MREKSSNTYVEVREGDFYYQTMGDVAQRIVENEIFDGFCDLLSAIRKGVNDGE